MAKSQGGGVTRKSGPAWTPKGSGAKRTPPLARTASGKPFVSTPKRVVGKTAAKVEDGGGKKMRS